MDNLNVYQPSGKFSPFSFIFFLLVAVTALPILGLVYAYCIWYIPFIYINFIIALAFGFITGLAINIFVIGKGKVRNVNIARLFGLAGALVAMYFHWSVWVDLVINAGEQIGTGKYGITVSNISIFQVFSLAIDPSTLFMIIEEIQKVGTWGLKGNTVSGPFLYVIWGVEALLIIVPAVIVTTAKSRMPYCEMSDTWFKEIQLPEFNIVADINAIIENISNNQDEFINDLTFVENTEQHHMVITLFTSEYSDNYLTIEKKIASLDKDNKVKLDTTTIVEYLHVDKKLVTQLLSHKPVTVNLGEQSS
ncbi:hypothetical protein KMW28_15965 [Flammeovirga yaeyamensis]|uniref:Uncharacterized protein n=1 Tax=Flammeovirga yaeyamensis TaxID=367791 RepID=A0AAX1N0Y0_9BACT|nr:hypothetical protein [Flammeovirga yaeyamensis]MBB3698495.1 hypothetical protein [Flammeovirga yaeyamensis]NMF34156.1 hypothetical protein [Flammeovirga yaeyamensis]QWG01141.1 hypothetical protein KMW28_15965 [Flammeovirga yaeyamensis]